MSNSSFSIFKINSCAWIYIYNNNYSIFLKLNMLCNIRLISSKTIIIKKHKYQEYISTHIKKYIQQLYNYECIKIKFSGKGYKIKKNNNKSLILLFNRAHITQMWWKNIILKKLKKYKIYIKHTNNNNFIETILSIRNINIFTKKGLRKSKQVLFKKKGKK
jgi:hypothetical protein